MTTCPPPSWLTDLAARMPTVTGHRFSQFLPPPGGGRRHSAVLVLFGPGREDLEDTSVVITERAHTMRSHPGQPAFPGGQTEPEDADAAATALREACEEVGLDPGTVDVLSVMPTLHIPVSSYDVTPVLGWWREADPESLWAKDPSEVARVVQPTVSWLVDPASRFWVRHPSGFAGPGWDVDGLLVWGFTAGVLDKILDLAGVARPWDGAPTRELPL